MERCAQFNSQPNDLVFAHGDQGCFDPDIALFCTHFDELIEGIVVGGTAVGIAGAVLLDCADKDDFCAQNLGPAYRGGEKMRVAEGDVGDGNLGGGSMPASGGLLSAGFSTEGWVSGSSRNCNRMVG